MSSVVVSGDTSGAITISAPAISGTNTLTLPAVTDTLVGKATTDTLTNKTLTSPVLSGTITGTYTLGGTPTVTGTLTAGTACVQSPFATSTTTTQAHGLGATPSFGVVTYIECLTTEHNYAVADRVYFPSDGVQTGRGFNVTANATNTLITTGATIIQIVSRATFGNVAITAANWKIVATPYKIN